ncbi:MAG: hypothetical protein AB1765_07505 [Candidatus Hydrogenedentota bacterium]
MKTFYELLEKELQLSPFANTKRKIKIITDRSYRPLRYEFGLHMFKGWDKEVEEKDKRFLFSIELVNLSFYLIKLVLRREMDKDDKAIHLLIADGLLTLAYKEAGDYLSFVTDNVDSMLRGRGLMIDLAAHKRKFVLLEEIIELVNNSSFKTIARYIAKSLYPETDFISIATGLGSMVGLYLYLQTELSDDKKKIFTGMPLCVNLKDILELKFIEELSIDILNAIEEYRIILKLKPETFKFFL